MYDHPLPFCDLYTVHYLFPRNSLAIPLSWECFVKIFEIWIAWLKIKVRPCYCWLVLYPKVVFTCNGSIECEIKKERKNIAHFIQYFAFSLIYLWQKIQLQPYASQPGTWNSKSFFLSTLKWVLLFCSVCARVCVHASGCGWGGCTYVYV
jgi:hypothetical protein